MNNIPFKEVAEFSNKKFADCSLGREASQKKFTKSLDEFDKPLAEVAEKNKKLSS